MNTDILFSPAKLNLTLQVLRKREDSYHEIYTIFHKITLFDEMEVTPSKSFELELVGEEPIPLKTNLVYRAYNLFKETFSCHEAYRVRLVKRIPIGAGLGGGSSNAGTFLRYLGERHGVVKAPLMELAKRLGADVTFFVEDFASAAAFGIGEILKPYPNFDAYYLLYYPNFKIETGWAYRALNLVGQKKPYIYGEDQPPWQDPKGLINDFKELIFKHYPVYKEVEKLIAEAGAKGVALTGTGSVIFGVFESQEKAFSAYRLLKNFLRNGRIYIVQNLATRFDPS